MSSGFYKRESLHDRFWRKVNKTNNCWIWVGNSKDSGGYGYISYKRKMYRAHRLSYQWHYGSDPIGLFVCHKCDNPLCIRPDHLFLGTPLDNTRDMHSKNRAKKAVGEKASKSKLTADQVLEIRELFPKLNISYSAMGKRYGVKHSSIKQIVNRISWRHI